MPSLDDYLSEIPPYNAVQPKFTAVLTALIQPVVDNQQLIGSMPQAFDLDTSIGAQLDIDGIWIGRSRFIDTPITGVYFSWDTDNLGWEEGYWQGAFDPDDGVSILDDDTYRKLLYAKAAANVGDTSLTSLIEVMNNLLDGEFVTAQILDNQDMTMTVVLYGAVQNLILRSIIVGGYLPIKPAGVQLFYVVADVVSFPASARITGVANVTFRANLRLIDSAVIHGVGAFSVGGFLSVSTPFFGVGQITARAAERMVASATVSETGVVTAIAGRRQPISMTRAGVGSVQADSITIHGQFASVTIVGAGSITANANAPQSTPITIDGVGAEQVSAIARQVVRATIAGTGSVSATLGAMPANATINGIGAFTKTAVLRDLIRATVNGVGSITASAVTTTPSITSNIHVGLPNWINHTFILGERCASSSNAYQCITAGTSTVAPTGTSADSAPGGTAHFKWLSHIDYTSLQAWSDAIATPLTLPVVGQIWNDGPILTTLGNIILNLSGHTTSATNTITLKPAPGEGFRDQVNTTPLTTTPSKGVTIQGATSGTPGVVSYVWINDANVIIDGIQFYDPLSTSLAQLMIVWTTNVTIQGCIFDGYNQGQKLVDLQVNATAPKIRNNLFIDRDPSSGGNTLYVNADATIVNNTFVSPTSNNTSAAAQSSVGNSGSFKIKNGIFMGWAIPASNDSNAVGTLLDHCVMSASGFGGFATDGGGNLFSKTAANQFVSATVDFRLKTGADAINIAPIDANLPADDFFRTARPQGALGDAGCFEFT